MPRKKPTKKLGVYGQFDLNPDKAVDLYVESKNQNKYYIKPPYWDIARESIELSTIQKDREYTDFLKIQNDLREKAKIDAKLNEQRIKKMYKIQKTLRERFIDVNDFIRDCEEKERSSEQKVLAEKKIHTEIEAEIEVITNDLQVLGEFHQELKQTTEEFKPYETVINDVVAESKLYKNVKDLIDRCDALMIAQVEITEMENTKIKIIEDLRIQMVKALNEAALKVMGLNNELAELERCYNAGKSESLKWEKILTATKDVIADKETLTFRLLDQIQQLYGILCLRSGESPSLRRDQVDEQLDFVKEEIEFIQEVIKVSKDMMASEKRSVLVRPGSKTPGKKRKRLKPIQKRRKGSPKPKRKT